MSISLDNNTDDATSTNGAASLTFAATASAGTNRLLLVGVYVGNAAGDHAEHITGVTYNSVAMTQVGKKENSGASGNTGWCYVYYLFNPATGSNNVVISGDSLQAGRIRGVSSGFSGVQQSGFPDTSTTNHSASSTALVTSITTAYDNPGDFVYLFALTTVTTAWSLGTGTTAIGTTGTVPEAQFQYTSNPVSPAGAVSMTVGPDVAAEVSTIMVGIIANGASATRAGAAFLTNFI